MSYTPNTPNTPDTPNTLDINNLNNVNKESTILSKNQILIQMLQLQRKGLPNNMRLDMDDIKRIVYNINNSPFTETECCLWNGYVTDNNEKCKYINFYFKHHKIALHRLLYINFVEDLETNNYLKFTCKNKGICCNIKHIEKSNVKPLAEPKKSHNNTDNHNNHNNIQVIKFTNKNDPNQSRKFIVVFD